MIIWFYVEGQSDRLALEALWARWKCELDAKGIGVRIIPLGDKARLLRYFGARCAEKLANNPDDLVVALPDLYPIENFACTEFAHEDVETLAQVLKDQAFQALMKNHRFAMDAGRAALSRVHISALKHDLEMLLLAAVQPLRRFLRTQHALDRWTHPVENQNHSKPPKRVVEELFVSCLRRRYRDTTDAPAILRGVTSLKALVQNEHGQIQCPVFKTMLIWLHDKSGVDPLD